MLLHSDTLLFTHRPLGPKSDQRENNSHPCAQSTLHPFCVVFHTCNEPEDFTGRIIFMSMFNDISWGSQDNEQECELSANLVSIYARRFSPGRWSFLGLGSEKKWYSTHDSKPQGEWDRVVELTKIKFSESGHPVFRATSPLSRGTLKSNVGGKYQYTSALMRERL